MTAYSREIFSGHRNEIILQLPTRSDGQTG